MNKENEQIIFYLKKLQKIIITKDMEELINIVTYLDYNDEDKINELIEYLQDN